MSHRSRRFITFAAVLIGLAASPLLTSCAFSDAAHADRQAAILGLAITMPRPADANGFARAALADWNGGPNTVAVLEATDLPHAASTDPAVQLVIRITVAAHVSTGFGDNDRPAYDTCYRLLYALPSSSQIGPPLSIDCPAGVSPLTPPPAPPVPHLPADATAILTRVLNALPEHPNKAAVVRTLRTAFPFPSITVDAEASGASVAVAVGVPHPTGADCVVLVRTAGRIATVHPDPMTLMPGEEGCLADQAIHPMSTH